jgi:hypothetical protein
LGIQIAAVAGRRVAPFWLLASFFHSSTAFQFPFNELYNGVQTRDLACSKLARGSGAKALVFQVSKVGLDWLREKSSSTATLGCAVL